MIFNPGRGITRVGEARVTKVYKQRLYDMDEADAGREGFDSLEAFIAAWRSINGAFFNVQRNRLGH